LQELKSCEAGKMKGWLRLLLSAYPT
jgi:hypothetical protein